MTMKPSSIASLVTHGRGAAALTATSLTKRYGQVEALVDCSFVVPQGSVAALVGANGAGKSTLLNVAAGLTGSTSGTLTVTGSGAGRGQVAFVSQDKPLYRSFKVREMLSFGRRMNLQWDQDRAEDWLNAFDVPLDRRCGQLSGGQQAQVALALALGTRPDVLLLDEPLANLDPLVREAVVRRLLDVVAAAGTTVVLSTHVIAELNGVADYLLLLSHGSLALSGDVDDIVASHQWWSGPRSEVGVDRATVIRADHSDSQSRLLVRRGAGDSDVHPRWTTRPVALEDLILEYLRLPASAPQARKEAS